MLHLEDDSVKTGICTKERFWCFAFFIWSVFFLLLGSESFFYSCVQFIITLLSCSHHQPSDFTSHPKLKKVTFPSNLHSSTFREHLTSLQIVLGCWCAHSWSLTLRALGGTKMSKSWFGDLLILQSVWIGGSTHRRFCSVVASYAHCVFCFVSRFSISHCCSEGGGALGWEGESGQFHLGVVTVPRRLTLRHKVESCQWMFGSGMRFVLHGRGILILWHENRIKEWDEAKLSVSISYLMG